MGTSAPKTGNLLPSSPPSVVTLGGTRFYRYTDVRLGVNAVSGPVYALPTTIGTVLGVCITQGERDFPTSCERILGTMRLKSGSALPPGQDESYASAVNTEIAKLNDARAKAGAVLSSAPTAQAQAAAATELAAAHANAAAALGALSAGPATPANSALVNTLRTTANGYTALAAAAAHNDASAYQTASSAIVRDNLALRLALERLSSLGYRVD
jgi:hypothetical protein